MFIARIRHAINVEFENEIGGYDRTFMMGDFVHIETKKGVSTTGILIGYEESKDELMQDVLLVETQDESEPIKKVGVNSIAILEVPKCQAVG